MADISATSGISGSTAGKSAQSLVDFSKNFDSFLLLLTQQLKNQDPLKPMNATEFTTQLVQFTGVEQAIRQNQNLEAMIALQQSNQSATAVSYLGKTVDTKGGSVQLAGGSAGISYTLPSAAKSVVLTITDAAGNTIRTVEVDKTAGPHIYTWDGRNNSNSVVPDGSYNVKFTAVDNADNPIAVTTTSSGKVTNVSVVDGKIVLTVGTLKIPLSEVTSVRETPIT